MKKKNLTAGALKSIENVIQKRMYSNSIVYFLVEKKDVNRLCTTHCIFNTFIHVSYICWYISLLNSFHRLYSHIKTGNWIQSGWIWIALCCTSVLLLHRTWLSSNFHDSQYTLMCDIDDDYDSFQQKIYKINNPFDLERVLCDFNDELNHEQMRTVSTCFHHKNI